MKKLFFTIFILAVLKVPSIWAADQTGAPDLLSSWKSWVLYGLEEKYHCPQSGEESLCAWPQTLKLDLNDNGGTFNSKVTLLYDGAFPLPGGAGAWPQNVQVNSEDLAESRTLPVLGRALPTVQLSTGSHQISGSFAWDALPQTITLPVGGILDLTVNGEPWDFPPLEIDSQAGRAKLWLKQQTAKPSLAPETPGDRYTVTVNRLIEDSQPQIIHTRLKLVVSGTPREIVLTPLLPETEILSLSSPLSTRLSSEGLLRVEAKAGEWIITLKSRSLRRSELLGPLTSVSEGSTAPEVWAWAAKPDLRLAELKGGRQIDASQADIYGPWQRYPLYLMAPGESLTFITLRRGDPNPPPVNILLDRQCWLDYDGEGLSCRDHLSGTLSRQWHLNTSPPFVLAQASVNGQPQVITWQQGADGEKAPGLQLREGKLNLTADLRLDNFKGTIPASGWDQSLEVKSETINLPPGYSLFWADGAEAKTSSSAYAADASWLGRWNVLDIFIVLIISLTVGKLYGFPLGALALFTLILCYPEAGAPRWAFIHFLAATALWRALEPGKLRAVCGAWRKLAALVLIIGGTFFILGEARTALYPQLENLHRSTGFWELFSSYWVDSPTYITNSKTPQVYEATEDVVEELAFSESPAAPSPSRLSKMARTPEVNSASLAARGQAEPEVRPVENWLDEGSAAQIQHNQPRPDWSWRSLNLQYNETVTAEQTVTLYLITPPLSRILNLLRAVGLALLLLKLLSGAARRQEAATAPKPDAPPAPVTENLGQVAVLIAVFCGLLLVGNPAQAQEGSPFPTVEMLKSYQDRLLTKDSTPPPGVESLQISATDGTLSLNFALAAEAESLVELPFLGRDNFQATSLTLNGAQLALLEDKGRWFSLVPQGIHQLLLTGKLRPISASFNTLQIDLPESLRPQKVIFVSNDSPWRLGTLGENGRPLTSSLTLSAQGEQLPLAFSPKEEDAANSSFSPFFQVTRNLRLGSAWRVETTVRRLTPIGVAATLRMPLWPGENPLSERISTVNGEVVLNFPPQQEEIYWESSLEIAPRLALKAASGPWSEVWLLDASPLWRVSFSGLVPTHIGQNDKWQPKWNPWPGEELLFNIDRPQAVPGRHLVIDSGQLEMTLGEKSHIYRLNFNVRTSQGGPYSFALPRGAEILAFELDGRKMPVASDTAGAEAVLTAPLTVGEHNLSVRWQTKEPLNFVTQTPQLDLGAPTANISLTQILLENRWIIWAWGPQQGPAVLFWPILLPLLLAAFILSRTKLTPLGAPSWFLLGLGLLPLSLTAALLVAVALLALGWRGRAPLEKRYQFNLLQIALPLLSLMALGGLLLALSHGLLGQPDMFITGDGSYGQHLNWFSDRSLGPWPQGFVLALPLVYYQGLTLLWALWLAISLIKWLSWGWQSYSQGGIWRSKPAKLPLPTSEN